MLKQIEKQISYSECDKIISSLDEEVRNRIPQNVRDFIKANSLPGYTPLFPRGVPFSKMKLSRRTTALMGAIYVKHICQTPEERKAFVEKLKSRKRV